jgi:predicted Zn-dependent protease
LIGKATTHLLPWAIAAEKPHAKAIKSPSIAAIARDNQAGEKFRIMTMLYRRIIRYCRKLTALVCSMAIMLTSVSVSSAQAQGLPLIRDAEIEGLMRLYIRPVLKAAGLNPRAVNVYLINNPTINAFVAGGQRIFIHTGLLQQARTPNEVIGVLAHETGHIAGGHLARLGIEMDRASNLAIISMLLGAAVAVGGGLAKNNSATQVGQATMLGGQGLVQRKVLSYLRVQESSADQAAMRYLTKTGQSGQGMLDLFHKLASQSLGSLRRTNPYTQSHPMPFERIRNLEKLVKKSKFFKRKDPRVLQLRHDLMQAKLAGFLSSPRVVYRKYPTSNRSLPARYARAIVAFRRGDINNALPIINGLIKNIPQNPYFWELKGQALLESGRPSAAVKPLKTALKKTSNNGLIGMLLARAYLGAGGKRNAQSALKVLRRAKRRENGEAELHRLFARAYALIGNFALAELETAEAAIRNGDKVLARKKGQVAMKRLKRGSPSWQRAKDIVNFASRK